MEMKLWIAKDDDGSVFLYRCEPVYDVQAGAYAGDDGYEVQLEDEIESSLKAMTPGQCFCLDLLNRTITEIEYE